MTMGRASALVIRTGMDTEMGNIANLIQDIEKILPLFKKTRSDW